MLADLFLCQPMVGPSMLGEFEPILGMPAEVWSLVGFGGSNFITSSRLLFESLGLCTFTIINNLYERVLRKAIYHGVKPLDKKVLWHWYFFLAHLVMHSKHEHVSNTPSLSSQTPQKCDKNNLRIGFLVIPNLETFTIRSFFFRWSTW